MNHPHNSSLNVMRVLLVEPDSTYAHELAEGARAVAPEISLSWAETANIAYRHLASGDIDLIVVSLRLPAACLDDETSISVIERLQELAPNTPIIGLSSALDLDETRDAIRCGIQHVAQKLSQDVSGVIQTIRSALEQRSAVERGRQETKWLHDAYQNLHHVIQSKADGMLVLDEAGAVLLSNPAAARIFGRTPGDIEGRPFGCPIVPGESVEVELGGRTAEVRSVQTTWERAPAFVVSIRDVTERKQIEDSLREMTTQLQRVNRQLTDLANEDPLTGLMNRRGMDASLRREVERLRREPRPLAAIIVDCDQFKRVNDRLGHSAGDVVLREVAKRLETATRPTDSLARIGGDEFLLLLPDTRLAEAMQVAERLRIAVAEHSITSGAAHAVKMTVSVGVAPIPAPASRVEDILPMTHLALKKSKAAGRNRISVSGKGSVLATDDEIAFVGDLERRLAGDDFFRPVSQPIMDLPGRKIMAREFFVRGPAGSYESPAEFFQLCRDLDILTQADLAAFRSCLAFARAGRSNGECQHFNLFPSTLLEINSERILNFFPQPIEPGRFCVELSEQQFVGDPSSLREPVMALRAAGVLVALDDVGFGGSALEGLIVLEPDVVKLDRRFVHTEDGDEMLAESGMRRSERLRRLVRLVGFSGATVIAEGIETAEDARTVEVAGVGCGQGYLLGAPS